MNNVFGGAKPNSRVLQELTSFHMFDPKATTVTDSDMHIRVIDDSLDGWLFKCCTTYRVLSKCIPTGLKLDMEYFLTQLKKRPFSESEFVKASPSLR
jgi:hypothetical protein